MGESLSSLGGGTPRSPPPPPPRAVPGLLSLLSPPQAHGAPVTAPRWHRGAGTLWVTWRCGDVGTDPMGMGQGCAPRVPPVCPPGTAAASPPPLSPGRWLQGLGLGWRYHGGRIYYFSWGKKPWREAREFCLSRQAQLTSITSWDEQEFLARESRGGSYWIGLEDGGPNDTWRWVDGTGFGVRGGFWAPGQPDRQQHGQQGREGCAQIHPVGTGLWNDHNCNIPFLWICKRGLGGP
uniref:C-type lectin domain-containing protein n=1 Tax=Anas platyrhynchos TaxID=8839 RepID=A0A8B9SLZ0_ANAPL